MIVPRLAAAVPVLRTVTVCVLLVVPTLCDAKPRLVGLAVSALWATVPGQTSNSETWPAGQPVLPVIVTRT